MCAIFVTCIVTTATDQLSNFLRSSSICGVMAFKLLGRLRVMRRTWSHGMDALTCSERVGRMAESGEVEVIDELARR